MSKDFYAVLAQELCSIKNSPFSLLSQQMSTFSNKTRSKHGQLKHFKIKQTQL